MENVKAAIREDHFFAVGAPLFGDPSETLQVIDLSAEQSAALRDQRRREIGQGHRGRANAGDHDGGCMVCHVRRKLRLHSGRDCQNKRRHYRITGAGNVEHLFGAGWDVMLAVGCNQFQPSLAKSQHDT